MATPKTPRKRADKPNRDTKADAPRSVPEAAPDSVIDASLPQKDPMEAKAQVDRTVEAATTDRSAKRSATPSGGIVEDAVVLNNPVTKPEASAPPEADPKPDPKPERSARPSPEPAAPTVVKSGPGFVPLVLGGIIAAGLGFALARYVVPEGWPMPGSSPLQTQLTRQAEEISSLRAELQALPKEDGTQAVLDEIGAVRETAASALEAAEAAKLAIANTPATVQGEDLTPRLAALEDRMTAAESRPTEGGAMDPAVVAKLTAEIDSLRSGLETQKAASASLLDEAEAVRAEATTKAQSVLLQAALAKVEAAIQSGAPFAEPLAQLSDAGVIVPAILADTADEGLPTNATLSASFDAPARAALEQSLRGNMGESWSERVGSFLRSQTGARSLTPQEGNDPDAILSRANAAVETGDLQVAITEIATLPEAAQSALAAWVDQAKLRIGAQTATVELATALSER